MIKVDSSENQKEQNFESIMIQLYPELKGKTAEEIDDFAGNLSEKEAYEINHRLQLIRGNKEFDYLTCHEPGRLDHNEEITDYENFYDFDKAWFEFQLRSEKDSMEQAIKAAEKSESNLDRLAKHITDLNEKVRKGYSSLEMQGDWFRLIDNNVFLYAQVVSAKYYLFYKAENKIDTLSDELIPYTLREYDDFTTMLNETDAAKKYDASGREYELESFNDQTRVFLNTVVFKELDNIIAEFPQFSGKVFRIDNGYEEDNFDPFTDFIFWDLESTKNIRPKYFLEDFKKHQLPFSELEKVIKRIEEFTEDGVMRIYEKNRKRYLSSV